MRRRFGFFFVAVLALTPVFIPGYRWKKDEPKRYCQEAFWRLEATLNSANSELILEQVAALEAVHGKTPQAHVEFIRKALTIEVSEDDLWLIAKRGFSGPTNQIVPDERAAWASQNSMNPENRVPIQNLANDI